MSTPLPGTICFTKPDLAAKHGEVQVVAGAILMDALIEIGLPVASSCGGEGVCTKCRLHVIAAADAVSPISPLEKGLLQKSNSDRDMRVSCQTQVFGRIEVDADYW